MALDCYFREDISNVLRSVNISGGTVAPIVQREIDKGNLNADDLQEHLDIYEQGRLDALRATAAAFGIVSNHSMLKDGK